VQQIRNASRQSVAVASSLRGACRAIAKHVSSAARELQTQGSSTPLFSPKKSTQHASPIAFKSPHGGLSQGSEPSSPGPGGASDFVELLPPESTRNVIVPLSRLQSPSQLHFSSKEEMKMETEVEGRDVLEGLVWAMHSPMTAVMPVLGLSTPATANATAASEDAQVLGWTGNSGSPSIRCGSLVARRQDWDGDSVAMPGTRGAAAGRESQSSRLAPSLPAACPLLITASFAAASSSDDGVAQLEMMRFYELQVRCEAPLPLDDISGGGYEVAVLIAKLAPQGSSGASAVVHAR
jgi:hypothetical protein